MLPLQLDCIFHHGCVHSLAIRNALNHKKPWENKKSWYSKEIVFRLMLSMLSPQIYAIGSRPLRYRALGGTLAALMATAVGASPVEMAPVAPNAPEYNHHSVALFNPLANTISASDRTGAINGAEMMKRWKDLRVPAAQIMALTEVLILTQSPILSANPATLQDAKNLSAHTYEIFELNTLAQINVFLSTKSVVALEQEGWLAPGSTLVNSRRVTDFSQVLNVWEQFSQFTPEGARAPLYNSDDETSQKMAQAVASLKIAIQDSGLNSLTVPLPMWSSSDHLQQIAFHVQQSNREMQTITKWDGPVLGLKERVNLTITYAHDLSMTSVVNNGNIDIQSSFASLAHEWEHALEYVLAQDVGFKPSQGPALLIYAAGNNNHHPFVEQWENVGKNIDKIMADSWYLTLQEKSVTFPKNAWYYSKKHEHMAYTFEAFAQGQLPANASLRYLPHVDRSSGIGPTYEQTVPTTKTWNAAFKYLKDYWWDGSAQIALEDGGFKNKLMSRRPTSANSSSPRL